MKRKLRCEIVTPEKIVYSGDVDMIIVPGIEGELGILPLHIPLVTLLKVGEIRLKYDDRQDYIAIDGGYMEVREDKVTILADEAEFASKIDVEKAKQLQEEAEKDIKAARERGEDFFEAQETLQKALNRLRVAEKR